MFLFPPPTGLIDLPHHCEVTSHLFDGLTLFVRLLSSQPPAYRGADQKQGGESTALQKRRHKTFKVFLTDTSEVIFQTRLSIIYFWLSEGSRSVFLLIFKGSVIFKSYPRGTKSIKNSPCCCYNILKFDEGFSCSSSHLLYWIEFTKCPLHGSPVEKQKVSRSLALPSLLFGWFPRASPLLLFLAHTSSARPLWSTLINLFSSFSHRISVSLHSGVEPQRGVITLPRRFLASSVSFEALRKSGNVLFG